MDARVVPLLRMPRGQEGFDYHIPDGLEIQPGDLVVVPFRKKKIRGVVWECAPALPEASLSIENALVSGALTPLQRDLYTFTAAYYAGTVSTLLKTTLPLFPLREARQFEKDSDESPSTHAVTPVLVLYDRYEKKDADALERIRKTRGTTLCVFPTQAALERFARILTRKGIAHTSIGHGQGAAEERDAYEAVRQQNATVVLTTKVGLFAPFPSLSTILIEDEAHSAHKQYDQQPYYDTRTLAAHLAKISGASLVLYAQSPRVASWYGLSEKTIQQERAGAVPRYTPPTILNIRAERHKGNQAMLGEEVCARLEDPAAYPALLYLNKKKSDPENQSRGLDALAFEVRERFPGKRVALLSGELQTYDVNALRQADILITTERIWSVLPVDLEMKTVIAVDADRDRMRTYFGAREKAFAGLIRLRNSTAERGMFYIQTREPSDTLFTSLREKHWGTFYREELATRNEFFYPPFAALTRLRFQEDNKETQEVLETLQRILPDGAELSPVFATRGRLPWGVLIKESPSGKRLGSALQQHIPPEWTIDVDPLDLE